MAILNRNIVMLYIFRKLGASSKQWFYYILFPLTRKMFWAYNTSYFTIFVISLTDTSFIIFIRQICKIKSHLYFFQLFEGPAVYPKLINRGNIISFTFKLHFFICYQFCSVRRKYCTLRLNLISTQLDDRGNVKLLYC